MRSLLNLFIILSAGTHTSSGFAFPELPFCPAGGPPGWLNYLNDRQDRNNWRRFSQHSPYAYNTDRYFGHYVPAYNPAYRQFDYTLRPYTHSLRN